MAITPNTPPRPSTVPRPGRPPGAGGNLNRNPSQGPGSVRPVIPGSVRPGTPTPPPHTPFQPGAPPQPPLPLWQLAGLLPLVLGKWLWDLLNGRGEGGQEGWQDEEFYPLGPVDAQINITWMNERSQVDWRSCTTGESAGLSWPPDTVGGTTGGLGKGVAFFNTSGTQSWTPPGGPSSSQACYALLENEAGVRRELFFTNTGGQSPGGGLYGLCGERDNQVTFPVIQYGGQTVPAPIKPPAPLLPQVTPKVPTPAPFTEPQPLPEPETPTRPVIPQAPPDTSPVPSPPSPGPGPGQTPGTKPVAPPITTPAPSPGPGRLPGPGVVPEVPAVGPLPLPPAPPVVTTPKEIVKVGDEIIGGPGQAPRPDLVAIAQELGRIEKKGEALLQRPSGADLPDAIQEILQALAEWLLTENDGTTYSIQPPCPTLPNGQPLPPVTVLVPPTVGPESALIARMDALAMLLDEHKQIRQPICKGRAQGQPVTVTFVEDL